jgi:integrase
LKSTPELKPSTRAAYASMIAAQLGPAFGKGLVHLIRAEDVNAYLARVAATLSPKTRRNLVVLLHKMLEDARASGYTATNPLRDTKAVRRPRAVRAEDDREVEILALGDVNRLLAAVTPAYHLFVLTLVSTGMRLNEATALQWGDVDHERHVIHVRRAAYQGQDYTPKSRRSARAIDVGDQLLGALAAFKRELPPARQGASERIFRTIEGGRIDAANFRNREWYPAIERAGVRRVVIHSLRHTYASQLLELGESIMYVSRQLGHASAAFTLTVYGHLLPRESRRTAAGQFEARLGEVRRGTGAAREHQRGESGQTGADEPVAESSDEC